LQSTFDLDTYMAILAAEVEVALEEFLPAEGKYLGRVGEAMRYSVFPGGKRFRPVLALAACEAVGSARERAVPVGAAFEMIHCFSLIHDDLPCMDNDDERRGRPTNHKVFGEDIALLAGDGLAIWAFDAITRVPDDLSGKVIRQLVQELAHASGHLGMVGGQVIDLAAQHKQATHAEELRVIHECKTGALIRGAVRCGALVGGADEDTLYRLTVYGEKIGLVFQITDDILDAGTDPEPVSFPAVYGMEESKRLAREAVQEALEQIRPLGDKGVALESLAKFLLTRTT
jgi:geranylgeranyl diphosphate synthase type II